MSNALTYPREWASFEGYTADRLTMDEAIQFVESVQSYHFGELIESHNLNVEAQRNPDDDPVMANQRRLHEDLDAVLVWLHSHKEGGQQTVSSRKVRAKIEAETGFAFEFRE